MATVLNKLATKGLIDRERSTVHSVVLIARLTQAGHAVLRKADRLDIDVERHLDSAFTTEEQADFHDLLERAAAALQAYEHQPPLTPH